MGGVFSGAAKAGGVNNHVPTAPITNPITVTIKAFLNIVVLMLSTRKSHFISEINE